MLQITVLCTFSHYNKVGLPVLAPLQLVVYNCFYAKHTQAVCE